MPCCISRRCPERLLLLLCPALPYLFHYCFVLNLKYGLLKHLAIRPTNSTFTFSSISIPFTSCNHQSGGLLACDMASLAISNTLRTWLSVGFLGIFFAASSRFFCRGPFFFFSFFFFLCLNIQICIVYIIHISIFFLQFLYRLLHRFFFKFSIFYISIFLSLFFFIFSATL